MNIAIRVNASNVEGSGHFYRTLYLARTLRSNKNFIFFICDPLKKNYIKILKKEKFKFHILKKKKINSKYSENDIFEVRTLIKKTIKVFDLLIVDSYLLGKSWELKIKKVVKKLLVIDDKIRSHACDIYLNQNVIKKNFFNTILEKKCVKLIGPKYSIINPNLKKSNKKISSKKIKNVLIFMGGADTKKLTLKILKIFKLKKFSYLSLKIVVGLNNKLKTKIFKLAKSRPNTKVYYNLPNLEKLIKSSDVAVSGGGSIIWEFIYLGLPSLIICQNILQFNNLIKLTKYKAFKLFVFSIYGKKKMINFFKINLLNNNFFIKKKIKKLFDGYGVYRIKKIIENL